MFQGVHFHSLLGDTDYFIYCQYIKFINERATCKACFAIYQKSELNFNVEFFRYTRTLLKFTKYMEIFVDHTVGL